MIKNIILFISYLCSGLALAQTITLNGTVNSNNKPLPFATVMVKGNKQYANCDADGAYQITVPQGPIILIAQATGYRTQQIALTITTQNTNAVNFSLLPDVLGLDEVVVSATRNRVQRRSAPVVVSALKPRLLTATQALSVAEGLNFSPGVRVENNCQNCGFTQVRLNGLDGAYTQILLNSRPVFTSLLGVYGLEQIPTNSIERVEVVRSGGSALYGSNAIAGTINIITKDPILNGWEIGSNLSSIQGRATDKLLTFNTTVVANELNSGLTLFGNYRNRQAYDHNGDGFTELVALKNNTLGAKAFLKPTSRLRLGLNLNVINENRRGGDRLDLAPQFTDITEQLDHDTFIGGLELESSNKTYTKKFNAYTSGSYTNRASYYGGLGGGRTAQDSISANNAYGTTKDFALVNGLQYTQYYENNSVLTAGVEQQLNATKDVIPGYGRLVDQQVQTVAAYGQFEYKPNDKFTTLLGGRLDQVWVNGTYAIDTLSRNVDFNQLAFSPRLTLSYQINQPLKFRAGYARGFRAPQAFNEDLHISSVAGEQQFVLLGPNLKTEYSDAFTASLNYANTLKLTQIDALLEGFYTNITNPFTTVSTGAVLTNGALLQEVRNGEGARVYGTNFEIGLSPNPKYSLQLGGTWQQTAYTNAQLLFESTGAPNETNVTITNFVRVPNFYGYLNSSWLPNKKFNVDITSTYTGGMTVPRVISDTGFLQLQEVAAFFDLNIKVETHFDCYNAFTLTLAGGVTNLFNSYQNDFDLGATRDSDYVYGPDAPRSFFIGLKLGSNH